MTADDGPGAGTQSALRLCTFRRAMSPLAARLPFARAWLLVPLLVASALTAQASSPPKLPDVPLPTMKVTGAGGFIVDYVGELDDQDLVVAVGKLGNWKEGKRERLADGQLGGGGSISSVGGTQYFKVPATATLQPRLVLRGKNGKVPVAFDLQGARLPDGKDQRQLLQDGAVALTEDTLALFVLQKRDKQKHHALLHVLPFDPKVDKGSDGELQFVDAMRDVHTTNSRVHALQQALDGYDKADDGAPRDNALAALRQLLEQKPEMKQPRNYGLLQQHCGPLEQRAKKRIDEAEAAKEAAEKPAADGGADGKR